MADLGGSVDDQDWHDRIPDGAARDAPAPWASKRLQGGTPVLGNAIVSLPGRIGANHALDLGWNTCAVALDHCSTGRACAGWCQNLA